MMAVGTCCARSINPELPAAARKKVGATDAKEKLPAAEIAGYLDIHYATVSRWLRQAEQINV
jgi:hypothetical protein